MSEEARGGSGPTDEQVRSALLRFAELVRRLDDDGRLLRALPLLLGRLGDLRRLLFEYEVRVTERLLPVEDPAEREARRIVREATERGEEMMEEWGKGWEPDDRDDSEAVG